MSGRECVMPGPRKNHRGVDLISDALPFDRLWYDGPNAATNAIGYAMHCSRSHDAVIRVYNGAANVIETHVRAGGSKGVKCHALDRTGVRTQSNTFRPCCGRGSLLKRVRSFRSHLIIVR